MTKNKYLQVLSSLVAISLLLSACSDFDRNHILKPGEFAQSERQRINTPDAPAGDMLFQVDKNNDFAFDLYQSLRAQDDNLFYSPYSISLALAMTYAGARNETASQMADTLHYHFPQAQLHPIFNALDLELSKRGQPQSDEGQPLQLDIANAIWAEQTYPFQQDFLDTIALNYGAGIHLADFINQAERARVEINNWVSNQTNDKIKALLPPGVVDSLTRMVLVNAIYFKADWVYKFDPNSTFDAPFHLRDGSEVSIPMMHAGMTIPYVHGDGYQAVELAYQGDTAVMDIIVPDAGNFDAFEVTLNADEFLRIVADLQPASVNLGLPKFNFTRAFDLKGQFVSMGMTDAFDPNLADFSGMSGNRELYITDILHKAFVAVDKDGTEAAAATAVIVGTTSMPLYEVELTVDRPFFFVIRDLPSGQILFMGRVLSPAQ